MATLITAFGYPSGSRSWDLAAGATFETVTGGAVRTTDVYPDAHLHSIHIRMQATGYYGVMSAALYDYNTRAFIAETNRVEVGGAAEVQFPFANLIPLRPVLNKTGYLVTIRLHSGGPVRFRMTDSSWSGSQIHGGGDGFYYGPVSNPFANYNAVTYANFFGVSFYDTTPNNPPNAGVINSPPVNGTLFNQQPKVRMSVTDPDANTLVYEIQFSTDAGFVNIYHHVNTSANPTYFTPNGYVASGTIVTWKPVTNFAYGTYYMRMRAYDGSAYGAWSATRILTLQNPNWTNPNMADDDFGIRKIHVSEIRACVQTARATRGVATPVFSDAPLTEDDTKVRAIHITELRAAINAVAATVGDTPTYADTITADVTKRRGKHIKDLRAAVQSL